MTMRIHGEGIKGLIPQRNPMIMVDEFESEDNSMAQTIINVRPDNMFVSQTEQNAGVWSHRTHEAVSSCTFCVEQRSSPHHAIYRLSL